MQQHRTHNRTGSAERERLRARDDAVRPRGKPVAHSPLEALSVPDPPHPDRNDERRNEEDRGDSNGRAYEVDHSRMGRKETGAEAVRLPSPALASPPRGRNSLTSMSAPARGPQPPP